MLLNLEISLVRTINIIFPFFNIRTCYLQAITAFYTILLLIWDGLYMYQEALPLLGQDGNQFEFLEWHFYRPGGYQQFLDIESTHGDECRAAYLVFVPFFLPAVLVVVSMIVQVTLIHNVVGNLGYKLHNNL